MSVNYGECLQVAGKYLERAHRGLPPDRWAKSDIESAQLAHAFAYLFTQCNALTQENEALRKERIESGRSSMSLGPARKEQDQ